MPDLFTKKELDQIHARGITLDQAVWQIDTLRRGVPCTRLLRSCNPGDGITVLDKRELERLGAVYSKTVLSGRAIKFVPASGAASRMFQSLLPAKDLTDRISDITNSERKDLDRFISELESFAFYDDLNSVMSRAGLDLGALAAKGEVGEILTYLLTDKGLNYGSLCKGLIKFHRYTDHSRTPFEEQLVEAVGYTQDKEKTARIHFTVPADQQGAIQAHIESVRSRYEQSGVRLDIEYSIQKPSTDTLAITLDGDPVRDGDGNLVFRPGGHGALLENLGNLDGHIIFIKNIDNVVPDRLKPMTYHYKKALGGLLVELQNQIFRHLEDLANKEVTDARLKNAFEFAKLKLSIVPPQPIQQGSKQRKVEFLMKKLNRPLRVCGMVPSTGAPGGGPFWVAEEDQTASLRIVESSEIDMESIDQKSIWTSATHFNPVDMVCGVRDFHGKPFDQGRFRDPSACFISTKSIDGKPLKALEHPGLWNGGMAHWNTVFMEVPLATFNPVKTVFDLLDEAHQAARIALPTSGSG